MNDTAYLDSVRNCHNWNSLALRDRVTRIPYFDQQTNVVQIPGHLFRNALERIESDSLDKVYEYAPIKYKKRKRETPLIPELEGKEEAKAPEPVVVDHSMIQPEREAKEGVNYAEMDEMSDVNEDLGDSPEEEDYDDISYTSRFDKRRRPASGRKRKPTSQKPRMSSGTVVTTQPLQRPTNNDKPYACHHCGARYKSKPGLNYHMAHVHQEFSSFRNDGNNSMVESTTTASNYCDFCLGDAQMNKKTGHAEELISCHDCGRAGHPTCLQFTPNMITSTKKYGWQCIECKSCAICGTSENDDQLLFCDDCDRGFHLYCLQPPLSAPPDGEWSCHLCQVEFGARASAPARQMYQQQQQIQ